MRVVEKTEAGRSWLGCGPISAVAAAILRRFPSPLVPQNQRQIYHPGIQRTVEKGGRRNSLDWRRFFSITWSVRAEQPPSMWNSPILTPGPWSMAAADLAAAISQYNGVTDINDGFARGKPQYDFKMLPEGRSVGLTAKDLGSQIRHAFYGAEALRQQRGRNELKVVVRLPEAERRSLFNLEQLADPDSGRRRDSPETGRPRWSRAGPIPRSTGWTANGSLMSPPMWLRAKPMRIRFWPV